ncbi:putative ammonium transporter 2 [Littorina saxatilis]|uniref:putative ammonium transporter 2 n=1 Tax=Littorina saxatilis TaxID=31220 RepID=UPI0038B51300
MASSSVTSELRLTSAESETMNVTSTTDLNLPSRSIYDDYDAARTARDWDDATWILTSSFIIFTMQSGFGMLESGCVSHKNEVNIMMKNVADVIFGGISYWMLGYGFSFGTDPGTNGFCGLGKFFLDPADDASMGTEYSRFVFQASFATTATTIVSGALAERVRFTSYLVFSFFNTFIYCFPAHWIWAESGWLRKLGVVDVAGDGPVHVVGGVSALIAAIMIKPRKGRFTSEDHHEMESPVGAILGLFILWWSWLAFNCGSTFGISGGKWKVASRAATNTLMAANSGGIVAFLSSYVVYRNFHVRYVINGVLGALVGITACCAVTSVKESLAIGGLAALFVLLADAAMIRLKIDDPVSAFAVHGVGGTWGLLATGLFAHKDTVARIFNDNNGLVAGGGFYLLGIQALAAGSIALWTASIVIVLYKIIDLTIGLRLSPSEEEVGADFIEHNVNHRHLHTKRRKSTTVSTTPLTTAAATTTTTAALPPRTVHVNPAYGLDDDSDSDSPACLPRKSIFTITSSAKATTGQNGHCVSGNGAANGRSGNPRSRRTANGSANNSRVYRENRQDGDVEVNLDERRMSVEFTRRNFEDNLTFENGIEEMTEVRGETLAENVYVISENQTSFTSTADDRSICVKL